MRRLRTNCSDSSSCRLTPVLDSRAAPLPAALFCAASALLAPLTAFGRVEAATQVNSPLSPQAQGQFHVMAGEMAAGRQLPETAAEEFLKALDFIPNAALAARATGFALSAQRDDLALKAARRWLGLESSSMDAREVIARLSLKAGNMAEARVQAEAIIQGHPGGEDEGYRHVALLLAQDKGTAAAALGLMRTLVAAKPQSAAAQRALALLAFRFEDIPTTEAAAREALRLAPQERESTLLLVAALVKRGDIAGADQAIAPLLEGKGGNDLRMGYAKLLIDGEQRPAAKAQLLQVLKTDASNPDAHLALGLLLLDERQPDLAEPHITLLLDQPDRKGDAAYYLGRIAEMRRQPAVALTWYEKVSSGTQVLDGFVRRARVLAQLKRLPEARELLAALRAQYPSLYTRLLSTEGELLIRDQAFIEALNLYDVALKNRPDDVELLYARSLLHERMNRFDLAEADLRRLIALDANDSRALNALGYMLTLHSTRFDEAAKLIARAYELEPNDPAIIDSMGWVQFKLGKAKDALPLLQKAHAIYPDPEVAAHLGEVLWTLGEKDKAKSLLESAVREEPDHRVLRDTLQRLLGTP